MTLSCEQEGFAQMCILAERNLHVWCTKTTRPW